MALAFDPRLSRSDSRGAHLRLVGDHEELAQDEWLQSDGADWDVHQGDRPVSVVAVVLIAVVVFGYLGFVRLNTGGPSTTAGGGGIGPQEQAVASAAPGDFLYLVQPGDTLWAIATVLAPGSDPRPIVARLEEANGGNVLEIGQRLVIPGELVSSKGATNLALVADVSP